MSNICAVTNGACSFVGLWSLNNLKSAGDLLPHADRGKQGALLEGEVGQFTDKGK